MVEKISETPSMTVEENLSLARVLFVSATKPLGQDSSDEDRALRDEAWKAKKPEYMAQARRMVRLLENGNFGVTLKFKE